MQEELLLLINKHLDGHIISTKGIPKALITTTTIYKTAFDDQEEFPDAFTDGGVGKAKFLRQNPQMFAPKINPILWEADCSGFYMRTGKSHKSNIKFDMTHAYKSFKNSRCFKGFPEQINTVLSFPPDTTASTASIFHHNGLLYVDYPSLNIEHLMTVLLSKTDKTKTYPRIYYENAGWYPIEIVEEIYKLYKIDPIVKAIAIGEDTFDIDITEFTNAQFRAFVGKTTSKYVSDTWRTTDENEYLRALYQLQDNVIGVKQTEVETGEIKGTWAVTKILSYSIEYTNPNKTPWQCPVVAVYVKAHQKLQLFKQYNLLVDNGILPRYISVDGIEISGNQKEKALPLFDTTKVDWNNFDFLDKHVLPKLDKLIANVDPFPVIENNNDEDDEYNNSMCMFHGREITRGKRDAMLLGNDYIDRSATKWRIEKIKPASFHRISVIERKVHPCGWECQDACQCEICPLVKYPLYDTYKQLPRLLHLSGSGGNGKTEMVVKLSQQYDNICYTATTHNACSELEMRGKALKGSEGKLNLTGNQQIMIKADIPPHLRYWD
jgi:hypothetical protein